MQLQRLRPSNRTDLTKLKVLVEGRGWKGAVPAALPENVLLELARDFRSFECNAAGEDDDAPAMEGPLLAVVNLLMNHPARGPVALAELNLSEDAMFNALQAYQWALEREIVTRIIGKGVSSSSNSLLRATEALVKDGNNDGHFSFKTR